MISYKEFDEFMKKAKGYCNKNKFIPNISNAVNNLFRIDNETLYILMKSIDEYNEPMLTDSERDYLKAVIKPFKDRIDYIMKVENEEEYLMISVNSITDYIDTETIILPYFIKGSKYIGMEINKKYTLKELGLED